MLAIKRFVVFTAAIGCCIGSAGCARQPARSANTARIQTASVTALPISQTRPNPQNTVIVHPARRDGSREAFLSTYNNPEQGISFRYPRNYSLEEGDVQEHSFFLERQEDLDTEQPGATLLATVLIPEDGYPNTTFEHGSLQLAINEALTQQGCPETYDVQPPRKGLTTTIPQGLVFSWSEQEAETAGIKILERKYTRYSDGTCYEFLMTLAAEESPDPDGFNKPADLDRIVRQLEKIVTSVQLFTKRLPPPAENIEENADRLRSQPTLNATPTAFPADIDDE